MSVRHLGSGSQQPPPKLDGKIRLYSMEYCPYAQRTRLVLQAKKIPHDIVNINLMQKPGWYFSIHPQGKVPAVDTGSEVVVESLDISEFLEKRYPDPPLYSKDSKAKERDQKMLQKIDPLTKVFHQCLLGQEKKSAEEWAKEFEPHINVFESELSARGTTFFGGDKPGIVDYMLWPWSERVGTVVRTLGQKLYPDTKFALMKKWGKAMKEDPACVATGNSLDKHWKFMQMMKKEIPLDYDNV